MVRGIYANEDHLYDETDKYYKDLDIYNVDDLEEKELNAEDEGFMLGYDLSTTEELKT